MNMRGWPDGKMIERNLSFSQMECWDKCKRQWWYQYCQGYRNKQQKTDFMRGSLLHFGMQYNLESICGVHQGALTPWEKAIHSWEERWKLDDEYVVEPGWFDNCKRVVDGAVDEFGCHWQVLHDKHGPLIERRMYINLDEWYRGITFIPDVVAEKLTDPFKGGIFAVDFKSFGKPKPAEAGEFDLQGAIYQKGLNFNGFPAIGSCLFQLGQPPRPPRFKKDGTMYAVDEAAIANWKAVANAEPTYRAPEYLEGIWHQNIVPMIQEMFWYETWHLASHGKAEAPRPSMSHYPCYFCDYKEPCQARLRGHDEDDILTESYNKRVKR